MKSEYAGSAQGEYFVNKPSLARQRVAPRHRPNNLTTTTVKTKIITRRAEGAKGWLQRWWLPWFATPEGGRL
jgi:hypothetical protein